MLERYPEGAPTKLIAMGLMITEADVERNYADVVLKLRTSMRVDA